MDKNKLIAARLKAIRTRKGILQAAIADYLGIDKTAYSRIETGQTQLTINYLFKIC